MTDNKNTDKNQKKELDKKSLAISQKQVKRFFNRHHGVIYAVLVCIGLAVAIYMLLNIINNSSLPADYSPPTTNTTFDTDTIERVKELIPLSEQPKPIELPEGRTNPFTQ